MASHRGLIIAMVLLAIAAACGISAVGQQIDGAPANNPDAGNGSTSSGGSSSGGSSGGGDGAVDGALPDGAVDAAVDAPPGCTCNGGCDGGCVINGGQNPVCPPGVARCEVNCAQQSDCDTVTCGDAGVCRVTCNGGSVCNASTLNCGTSACQIRCIGKDACNSTAFEVEEAASVCLFCDGDPGCNSVTCLPPMTCTRQFTGGSGNEVGGCDMCPTGTCP